MKVERIKQLIFISKKSSVGIMCKKCSEDYINYNKLFELGLMNKSVLGTNYIFEVNEKSLEFLRKS